MASPTGALLDTPANYSEAKNILVDLDTSSFRVVTKTIGLSHGLDRVIERACQSATALKADALLVHAVSDLEGSEGEALLSYLCWLKEEGVFRKIGISVYVANDPAALAER